MDKYAVRYRGWRGEGGGGWGQMDANSSVVNFTSNYARRVAARIYKLRYTFEARGNTRAWKDYGELISASSISGVTPLLV